MAFGYLQRRKLYNFSGEPVSVLTHPYSTRVEPHVFQFLPTASHLEQIDMFVLNSSAKRQTDTKFLNAVESLCDSTEEPSGSWHLIRYCQ